MESESKHKRLETGYGPFQGSFPETDDHGNEVMNPGDIVRDKYEHITKHLKELYDTSVTSVDKLAECCDDIADLCSMKEKTIVEKSKVDSNIKDVKKELAELKEDSSILKKEIEQFENNMAKKNKQKVSFEKKLDSYHAQVSKFTDKREKLMKKQGKVIGKL
jgi:chromosome segregation ATPase